MPAPSTAELEGPVRLVRRTAVRIGRSLERSGLMTRDIENAYLAFDPSEEPPIHGRLAHFDRVPDRDGPSRGPQGVHE